MKKIYFRSFLSKKLIFQLIILCITITFYPSYTHANEPNNNLKKSDISDKNSPEVLRNQKISLERELKILRSNFEQKKLEIQEVEILEFNVAKEIETVIFSSIPNVNKDNLKTTETKEELQNLAKNEVSIFNDQFEYFFIDDEEITTLGGKNLALNLIRKINSQQQQFRISLPLECSESNISPSSFDTEENKKKIINSCISTLEDSMQKGTNQFKNLILDTFSQPKINLKKEINSINNQINNQEELLMQVENLIGTSEDITDNIVKVTIPILGLFLVLLLLSPRFFKDEIQVNIFNSNLILELLTVYILVSTILVLGLANRIENEVLGTLLGGISGYVLGRTVASKN